MNPGFYSQKILILVSVFMLSAMQTGCNLYKKKVDGQQTTKQVPWKQAASDKDFEQKQKETASDKMLAEENIDHHKADIAKTEAQSGIAPPIVDKVKSTDINNSETEATIADWEHISAVPVSVLSQKDGESLADESLDEALDERLRYEINRPELDDKGLYQRAGLRFKSREYQLAIDDYQQLIDYYPESRNVESSHYWVAESLYRMGKAQEAVDKFTAVLKKYPGGKHAIHAELRLGHLSE